MKWIIGVSGLYHDSAAALTRGAEIVAAAQEERFTRRKNDARFPSQALAWCIKQAGGVENIDTICFYEDPALTFDRVIRNAIELAPSTQELWPQAALSQLREKLTIADQIRRACGVGFGGNINTVDHHRSHAASAFFPSPFSRSAVVVVDGVGEWASTTIWSGDDRDLIPHSGIDYPHSLGLLYSAFTYHCGLKVNSGEYKLMGLAPYGEPLYINTILDNLIDLKPDGSFRLNIEYFGYLTSDIATNDKFERLMNSKRRKPEEVLTKQYMDIAASAQAVLNEAMLRICRTALQVADTNYLCLAGGVALNCVSNGVLLKRLTGLKGLWIQPASGDAGGALGAALAVAHERLRYPRHHDTVTGDGQKGSLLGPSFTREEIEQALCDAGITYHAIVDQDQFCDAIARAIVAGKIVGRFNGPMEYGPRALGNRSILADPRRPDGQAHINMRIKFRESWRPFAPVVLSEHVATYFDLNHESPYMLLVADLKEEYRRLVDWSNFRAGDSDMLKILNQERSALPAITHVDYSARIQSVDSVRNPSFHKLLSRFHALTGCPVLVNTSFNQRGEPIVCSPADAIRCFVNTGIDVLAIGGFVAYKDEQSTAILVQQGKTEYEED